MTPAEAVAGTRKTSRVGRLIKNDVGRLIVHTETEGQTKAVGTGNREIPLGQLDLAVG